MLFLYTLPLVIMAWLADEILNRFKSRRHCELSCDEAASAGLCPVDGVDPDGKYGVVGIKAGA